MKVLLKNITLFFLLAGTSYGANMNSLSGQLLEIFGEQCRSVGSYTNNAISKTKSLISLFESMINDPLCGAESQSLINLVSVFREQLEYRDYARLDSNLIGLERRIEELTLTLDSLDPVDDASLISAITSQLASSRIQLIGAKANFKSSRDIEGEYRKSQGYYQASSALKTFLERLPNIQNCSDQVRHQFTQVMGSGLAVGSYFASPAMSVAMSGIADIASVAINSIYELIKRRRIRKVNEVTLPTALSCSVEALTDLYCETIRAERIVEKYADYEEDDYRIWRGIPIIFRKLNPLMDWLELVRAGSPASDSYDAQRRLEVMKLKSYLEELRQKVQGVISEKDRELENLDIDLSNYIASEIDTISNFLKTSKALVQLNGTDFLPFRLIGFSEVPKCSFNGRLDPCGSLQQFKIFYNNGTNQTGYTFTLNDWNNLKSNFPVMYREAVDFVNSRLGRVLNEDQDLVVTRVFEGYDGWDSPYKVLKILDEYFEEVTLYLHEKNLMTNYKYNSYISNIDGTRGLIQKIIVLLDEWNSLEGVERRAGDRELANQLATDLLGKVYSLLKLQTGNQYITDRIKSSVTWDILAHMEHGEFDDELSEIIRLNNGNIISDITYYKLFDIQDIINDITNAKGIIRATLGSYFWEMKSFFKDSFNLIEREDLDPSLKNRLCIHLLSSDLFSKGFYKRKFLKQCSGVKLTSIFDEKDLTIHFDDYISSKGDLKKSFDERACLYNNFMRKVRIRERFKKEID